MKIVIKVITIIALSVLLVFVLAGCDVMFKWITEPPLTGTSDPTPTPEATTALTPEPTPEPTPELSPESTQTPPASSSGGSFPFAFTAEDIFGNTVTEATLGDKELFFIHFWGTWCPPCLAELPDLAQLERDFSDKVGFLMLLDDFENKDKAIALYNEHNFPDIENSVTICGVTTFDLQHEIMQMLSIQFVPTTIIIDSGGNMLEHLVGAHFELYATIINAYLN